MPKEFNSNWEYHREPPAYVGSLSNKNLDGFYRGMCKTLNMRMQKILKNSSVPPLSAQAKGFCKVLSESTASTLAERYPQANEKEIAEYLYKQLTSGAILFTPETLENQLYVLALAEYEATHNIIRNKYRNPRT